MKTSETPPLAAVDAYPVPSFLAERIARIHNVPVSFAEGLIVEAKRMLYLMRLTGKPIAPSGRVDWAWHEMILFTRFYRDFCIFIGGFIHHDPNPPSENVKKEETWEEIQATLGHPRKGTQIYIETKEAYRTYFHEEPNPLYWP